MIVTIHPGTARGTVAAPPSKSCGHRMLLCSALASGESVIRGISGSQDMAATMDCIRAMGGQCRLEGDRACVTGTGVCRRKGGVSLPGKRQHPAFLHSTGVGAGWMGKVYRNAAADGTRNRRL